MFVILPFLIQFPESKPVQCQNRLQHQRQEQMSVAAVQKLLCLAEKWSQVCHPQNFHDFFEQFSSLCAKKYQNCCMIIFRQNVMFQKLSSIQGNFLLNIRIYDIF